jgi:hypothetical protein
MLLTPPKSELHTQITETRFKAVVDYMDTDSRKTDHVHSLSSLYGLPKTSNFRARHIDKVIIGMFVKELSLLTRLLLAFL